MALVRSKQRVADHGEVFTPAWLVEAMLDLVKAESDRIDSRFLEPACGSGNFTTAEIAVTQVPAPMAATAFGTGTPRRVRQTRAEARARSERLECERRRVGVAGLLGHSADGAGGWVCTRRKHRRPAPAADCGSSIDDLADSPALGRGSRADPSPASEAHEPAIETRQCSR